MKKVNAVSNLVCILFFAVVGTVSFLFPEQIIGIFTQATDTGTLALATPYMRAAFWLYLAFCLMATSLGHINGVGFTTLNLVIAVLDGVIGRIGLSLLFGLALDWGVGGLLVGQLPGSFHLRVYGPGVLLLRPLGKAGADAQRHGIKGKGPGTGISRSQGLFAVTRWRRPALCPTAPGCPGLAPPWAWSAGG